MALSDACSEFNHGVVTAAERLGVMVEEYATPPYSYEQEEKGSAGGLVLTRLQRAVMLLMALADYTRNRHDAGPNLPPYDPPTGP